MANRWTIFWWNISSDNPDRLDFQVERDSDVDATGLFHVTRAGEIVFDYDYNDNTDRPFPFRDRLPDYIVKHIEREAPKIFAVFDSTHK